LPLIYRNKNGISNVMRMKRFRKKTFIRYAQSRNIGKPIDFKILETRRVHLANLRFYLISY